MFTGQDPRCTLKTEASYKDAGQKKKKKNVLSTPTTQQEQESEQRVLASKRHFLRTTSCEVSGRVLTMAGGG